MKGGLSQNAPFHGLWVPTRTNRGGVRREMRSIPSRLEMNFVPTHVPKQGLTSPQSRANRLRVYPTVSYSVVHDLPRIWSLRNELRADSVTRSDGTYGMASVSRIDLIIGLFCKRDRFYYRSLLQKIPTKETIFGRRDYIFIDPAYCSHPIASPRGSQISVKNDILWFKKTTIVNIVCNGHASFYD